MRTELRDSLEFLYADSTVGPVPCVAMTLDVARGGTAAVQVLLNDLTPGKTLRCHVVGADGQWFRLVDVPVEENTGLDGFTERDGVANPYVARRAPFRVFDAMQPLCAETCAVEPVEVDSHTMALRLHLPIARDAAVGEFRCHLDIDAGGEPAHLALLVRVHAAVIPEVGASSFPYTNWFSFDLMATRHDLEPWSEEHWQMIARYAALMAHGRQNTFWVPQGDIFGVVEGKPVLNRERLRRIVQIFTDAGMHYIEGGHFGARTTEDWHCPTFSLTLTKSLATSAEGNADITVIARQLKAEITRNNWHRRWLQHIADEPIDDNAADYRIFTGMVRKYLPGLPILDATMYEGLVGSVNIWCPQAQEYQRHQEFFAAQRALDDKVWFYTCCFPGGPWLNRLLDMELLRPALFGWAAARFGLNGFLHWGLNHYRPEQDPFQQSVVGHGGEMKLPAGDTHLVYPGADGPWSSVRLEAQREGCEDYQLLQRLAPEQAQGIIAPVLRAFDDYTKDVQVIREARRKLYEAIAIDELALKTKWEEQWEAEKAIEDQDGAKSTAIFLSELRHVLQALALPQPLQQHVKPYPKALPMPGFNLYYECVTGRGDIKLTEAQQVALDAVMRSIESSEDQHNAFSTMKPSASQEQIRINAIAALDAFGWPAEMPPLPRSFEIQKEDDTGLQPPFYNLYKQLHIIRLRPNMFFSGGTANNALSYICGIEMGLLVSTSSFEELTQMSRKAEANRGWLERSMHFSRRLLDRGWSERAVIDEIIAVEIDAVAMMMQELKKAGNKE